VTKGYKFLKNSLLSKQKPSSNLQNHLQQACGEKIFIVWKAWKREIKSSLFLENLPLEKLIKLPSSSLILFFLLLLSQLFGGHNDPKIFKSIYTWLYFLTFFGL